MVYGICICTYIHNIYIICEVGGEFFVTPTGKSLRFVRVCEREGDASREVPVTVSILESRRPCHCFNLCGDLLKPCRLAWRRLLR